jgi:hypothetical protein
LKLALWSQAAEVSAEELLLVERHHVPSKILPMAELVAEDSE